ncbi:MAG: hypothetical protein MJ247_06540 [Alphaproteobacteria bacterium]|nr:hypothetical protein [Alphaproteobacteria bacterium]
MTETEYLNQVMSATENDFTLSDTAEIWFKEEILAKLVRGRDNTHPVVKMVPREGVDFAVQDKIKQKLSSWIEFLFMNNIRPLVNAMDIITNEKGSGSARAIIFQIIEKFGTMPRANVQPLLKDLSDTDKKALAKTGIRLGHDFLFFPVLLKPAAQRLCAMLWKIWNEKVDDKGYLIDGRMNIVVDKKIPHVLYLVQGYALAGTRAVRVDVMERLTAKLREVFKTNINNEATEETAQETSSEDNKKNNKKGYVTLPPELLSLAGLKRDEAVEVFSGMGFKVFVENEQLKMRPVFKKNTKKEETVSVNPDSPFAKLAMLKK